MAFARNRTTWLFVPCAGSLLALVAVAMTQGTLSQRPEGLPAQAIVLGPFPLGKLYQRVGKADSLTQYMDVANDDIVAALDRCQVSILHAKRRERGAWVLTHGKGDRTKLVAKGPFTFTFKDKQGSEAHICLADLSAGGPITYQEGGVSACKFRLLFSLEIRTEKARAGVVVRRCTTVSFAPPAQLHYDVTGKTWWGKKPGDPMPDNRAGQRVDPSSK
jgi:hypothetical protein